MGGGLGEKRRRPPRPDQMAEAASDGHADDWREVRAAIAAGVLKRFNAAQMLELINCAATMGMASSRQTLLDGATVRNIFTGHSGFMGLTAARLVECG